MLSRFATKEREGLLLYNGRFNERHDFIALEIVQEQVQLTFSAGTIDLEPACVSDLATLLHLTVPSLWAGSANISLPSTPHSLFFSP